MTDHNDPIASAIEHGDLPPDPAPPLAELTDATLAPDLERDLHAIIVDCSLLDHSDTDNATRLLNHFGHDMLVLEQNGIAGGDPIVWNGRIWDIADGAALALLRAQRIGDLIKQEAAVLEHTEAEERAIKAGKDAKAQLALLPADLAEGEREDRERELHAQILAWKKAVAALSGRRSDRRKKAIAAKNLGKMQAMLDCAAPRIRRSPEIFNADPYKIATLDHTLRFVREIDLDCPDPDALRYRWRLAATPGHAQADLITALVPVVYDGAAAPVKFAAFLDRFMPPAEADKRRTLQQYCGMGLLGIVVQFVMYHYGDGANGKSVFLETLLRLLGDSFAVSLPPETLVGSGDRNAGQASPDIIRLFGKRMLRVPELKQGASLQEDLIKRITGGEKLTARTLYKGYVDFQNKAKPHMSGNGFPKIDGTDAGIWRRMLVMHWTQTIAQAEQKEFEEVVTDLLTEAPAILNWLIEGALDFLNNGFFIAPDVRKATAAYRDDMDVVGQFRRACVVKAADGKVQARAMYLAFKHWCEANAKTPVLETRFGREMKKHLAYDDAGRVNFYTGVRLEGVPEIARERHAAEPPHAADAHSQEEVPL